MKYSGTYSCGHNGEIELFGPNKEREWKYNREFSGLCPECYKKKLEEENAAKAVYAQNNGLLSLEGSIKQVNWANKIRDDFLIRIDEAFSQLHDLTPTDELNAHLDKLTENRFMITQIKSASWFIDVQFFSPMNPNDTGKMNLKLRKILGIRPEESVYPTSRNAGEAESQNTNIIRPEEPSHEGWVDLSITGAIISATYVKDDSFRAVVKSSGLHWDSEARVWRMRVGEMQGACADCVAELASKLLKNGFSVLIHDKDAHDKTIHGDYAPRHYRWVSAGNGGYILHYPKNDGDAEGAIKKLIGYCKWNGMRGGFEVSKIKTESVKELARLYGFKMTVGAQKLVEDSEAMLNAATTIEPTIKNPKKYDGLKEILQSSRDVLDDLKDDI